MQRQGQTIIRGQRPSEAGPDSIERYKAAMLANKLLVRRARTTHKATCKMCGKYAHVQNGYCHTCVNKGYVKLCECGNRTVALSGLCNECLPNVIV